MQSTPSTDASLALLRETVAYLRRLPVVPSTVELIRKIEVHLDSPISKEVSTPTLSSSTPVEGLVTTAFGLVLFSVHVENGQASVLAPVTRRRDQDSRVEDAIAGHFPTDPAPYNGDDPMEDFPDRGIRAIDVDAAMDRTRLQRLHMGVTVDLVPSKFPSTHALLVEESQSNVKGWR